MRFPKHWLSRSEFVNNVLKLLSGNSLAAAITFLSLPVITRMYSNADFGNYQLAVSLITLFGLVATLKYELAIVLPREEEEANELTVLALLVLAGFGTTLFLAIWVFERPLLELLNARQLQGYGWTIAVGAVFIGLFQTSNYMLIRNKLFGDLARKNLYRAIGIYGGAILLGLVSANFFSLFVSFLIGALVPSVMVFVKRPVNWQASSRQSLLRLARNYKKFPMFNTLSVFLNNFSMELPIFMIFAFHDHEVAGLYALANRLIVVPLNLLGTSVAQVYMQAASESFNAAPEKLMGVYKQTIKKLSLFGLLPVTAVWFLAPVLVGHIFGEQWTEAGVYMQILSINLYFRFVNSPISVTFSVINRQEVGLIIVAIFLAIRFAMMYLFRETPESLLWALSISGAVFYSTFNYCVYVFIRKKIDNQP
ncbi:MAG: lipopolysaccharide biosynthesis protein [Calditrichia bacterium]